MTSQKKLPTSQSWDQSCFPTAPTQEKLCRIIWGAASSTDFPGTYCCITITLKLGGLRQPWHNSSWFRVRNSGKAQLRSSSAPRGVDWSHSLTISRKPNQAGCSRKVILTRVAPQCSSMGLSLFKANFGFLSAQRRQDDETFPFFLTFYCKLILDLHKNYKKSRIPLYSSPRFP